MEHLETLKELRPEFYKAAFWEGKCAGLIRDGVYHPPTDMDCLCMYCGAML